MKNEPKTHTRVVRANTSFVMTPKPYGGYSIDKDDSGQDRWIIMQSLGISMEKQLCLDRSEFKSYLKGSDATAVSDDSDNLYNFTMVGL